MDAIARLQLCGHCLRSLPETEFRFRSKATRQRMHQCRECTTTAQRQRRHARRTHTTKRAMVAFTRQLARTADAKRVSWLANDAIDQLGGLHRFADAYREHFDAVRATSRGSRETLNALVAIANLSAASATLNPPRNPNEMSDQELQEHIQSLLEQTIMERLPDLLMALEREGWCIEPPGTAPCSNELAHSRRNPAP